MRLKPQRFLPMVGQKPPGVRPRRCRPARKARCLDHGPRQQPDYKHYLEIESAHDRGTDSGRAWRLV
jgi:hypothetical protein